MIDSVLQPMSDGTIRSQDEYRNTLFYNRDIVFSLRNSYQELSLIFNYYYKEKEETYLNKW